MVAPPCCQKNAFKRRKRVQSEDTLGLTKACRVCTQVLGAECCSVSPATQVVADMVLTCLVGATTLVAERVFDEQHKGDVVVVQSRPSVESSILLD